MKKRSKVMAAVASTIALPTTFVMLHSSHIVAGLFKLNLLKSFWPGK